MFDSGSLVGSASVRRGTTWWFTAALVVLVALVGACSEADTGAAVSGSPIRLLEASEFADFMESNPDVAVINVHIPYQGHIAGTDAFVDFTQILDYDNLPNNLDDPVIVYCRSGNMSAQSASDLAAAGYTNVIDLNGGMNAWEASGRELLTDGPGSS